MTLMDAEIFRSLPKFGENSGDDPVVHLKYYGPDSAMTWFVTEGQVENGEYRFWGIIVGPDTKNFGYFTLRELQNTQGPDGDYVARDEAFIPRPMSQIVELMGPQHES